MRCFLGSLLLLLVLVPAVPSAQDAQTERIEANGAQFPYVSSGDGEPVLFVHGSFADHRAWEPLREAVAEHYRFIAYTQRGFGTDDWPDDQAFSRDVHEADLIALLETWQEPMHLVGWSYSGPIVLQAALDQPDLVRRVVIFEPALGSLLEGKPEYEEAFAERREGFGPFVEAAQRGENEEAIRLALEYVFGLPEGGFETLPPDAQTMFLDNAHTVPKELGAPDPTPMTCDDLSKIEVPVLILWGTETKPYYEAATKEVADCLPHAVLDHITGVGHGGPLQASDAFLDKMLTFISEAGN